MAASIVTAMTVALTACTATNPDTGVEEADAALAGEVPTFEGPYAAEFAEFYRSATSDFARDVLEDGKITDAEYAEMETSFASCLAEQGITFEGFDPDGGYTASVAPNGGDTHAIASQCEQSSGADTIGALHDIMRVNPENLNSNTIMVDCLVREGVVPPDYSVDDFSQDNTGRFADFENLPDDLQEALISCSSDPLDILD